MKRFSCVSLSVALVLALLSHAESSRAQATVSTGGAQAPAGGGVGGGGAAGAQAGAGGGTGAAATGPAVGVGAGGGAAPVQGGGSSSISARGGSIGGVIGGGNVSSSSSRPLTGPNDRDSFDLGTSRGGSNTVFGSANGAVDLGSGGGGGFRARQPFANSHVVRKGDTLWDICDAYFANPFQWPRVWSFNPQIQNPHWIFPGDIVRLRGGATGEPEPAPVASGGAGGGGGGSLVDRRRQVPPGTVFLRNQGFIEDDDTTNWGEINGAREEKMFLSDLDEVYIRLAGDHEVKLGQELTVFRPIRNLAGGKMIQIQGTVRIDNYNPKEHVARAQVVETLDVIERGARVGPVLRKYEVVPPLRNENDVRASILSAVFPHPFYGQNQVVFVDKGEQDGLKPGNRLFVIRKGDGYHQTLPAGGASKRVALESESPAEVENIPQPRSRADLPEEVEGELRVLNVRKHSAACLVLSAKREIEQGEFVYARKGY